MKQLLNNITRSFLINEGRVEPSTRSYLQSISEIINSISPKSRTDERRIEIVKSHLLEVRRSVMKLEERVQVLEEQVKVLEEEKNKTNDNKDLV